MKTEDIAYVLRDNFHAIRFFEHVRLALHFWDDLHDADKPITKAQIHDAMWSCLVELPSNPFYQKHFQSLQATLHNAIANWIAANIFEQTDDEKKLSTAYIIRSDYANLLIQCAYLTGGRDWMWKVTPLIRHAWTSEDFVTYKRNLGIERARNDKTSVLKSWYEQETDEYLKHGLFCFNAAMLGQDDKSHVEKIYELAQIPKGAVIVDMGAGAGGLITLMREIDETIKGYGVTNVNRQFEIMSKGGKVEPVLCDYHDVPIAPESADVVVFNESIGYGNLKILLKEAWRLLKKGGVTVIKDGEAETMRFSDIWQYITYANGDIERAAESLGFSVEMSQAVDYNQDRFAAFLQSSKLMNDRYGEYKAPHDAICKLWKLRKV